MKYNHFFRNNLTNIAICLAVLFLIYYLFSNYNFAYKTPFGYIEHLTNSPNCKTFNCSDVHGPSGTTYKPCVAGDNTCKEGQRCSACIASSTNPSCAGTEGCVGDGKDPYGQPGHLGHDVGCCSGTEQVLNVWDKDGRNYFKCCKPKGPSDECHTDADCADHGHCGSGPCICQSGKCIPKPSGGCKTNADCTGGQICQSGSCVPSGGGGCNPACTGNTFCQNGKCVPGGNSPTIQNQPGSTIQIVNNTSENPLHVFLGTKNDPWLPANPGGNGKIYPAIAWGSSQELVAWDPIGAGNISEAIIPKNGYIILKLPSDMFKSAFRVTALKLKNNDNTPLKSTSVAKSKVLNQWPILFEGGAEVVADTSAVDGINFKMKYELTGKDGIQNMEIHKNPCASLESKYQLDVGCRNPAKVDCSTATCTCCCCADKNGPIPGSDYAKGLCKIANQDCKFNACSEKLFNIPSDLLNKFKDTYDGGNPNDVVKKFINKSTNLKDGSPLRRFCEDIQFNTGDFTTYCYDYNDVSSSPWLSPPYKVKITYMDL